MKKIILLTTLLVGIYSIGQNDNDEKFIIKKGTINIGGSLNLNFNNQDFLNNFSERRTENSNFTLQPRFGYFVTNNIEIGLAFSYQQSKSKLTDRSENIWLQEDDFNSIGFLPFIRAYKPIHKKLLLFTQAEAEFTNIRSNSNFQNGSSSSTGNAVSVAIKPGITYFISKRIGLEASLGGLSYRYSNEDFEGSNNNTFNQSTSTRNSFNFSLNPSDFLFGLSFYF